MILGNKNVQTPKKILSALVDNEGKISLILSYVSIGKLSKGRQRDVGEVITLFVEKIQQGLSLLNNEDKKITKRFHKLFYGKIQEPLIK